MRRFRIGRVGALSAAAALALTTAACGSDGAADGAADATGAAAEVTEGGSEEALTIYSGRSEELVGPVLEDLEEAVGTEVDVRYAGSSELAAQLLEEGEATDADLFFSQDAGALGALANSSRCRRRS
jgi:iron(III) transport system substrate-binding protein